MAVKEDVLPWVILQTLLMKVRFPKFDGENVREWVYKCNQLFFFHNTDTNSKVEMVGIHLDGKAKNGTMH